MLWGSDIPETRGDVLIQILWELHTDAMIDIKLGDTDAYTYRFEPMEKILACWEKMKKDKHSNPCHKQRKFFSLFLFLLTEF